MIKWVAVEDNFNVLAGFVNVCFIDYSHFSLFPIRKAEMMFY